jgi:hypothetical protein
MPFAIVAKFVRESSDHDFFYREHDSHPVTLEIKNNFEAWEGNLGKHVLKNTDTVLEVALVFQTQESFVDFVMQNEYILRLRNDLIYEYCEKTGHTYEYYSLVDFDTNQN